MWERHAKAEQFLAFESERAVKTGTESTLGLRGRGSRLETLFGDIAQAVSEGRLEAALRLADCACRIAPEDATSLLVYARLLIRLGAAAEAADRLRARQEPGLVLARAEALFAQDLFLDGAAACESLLARFAVGSVANLEQFAAQVCRMPRLPFPGWVGVVTGFRLVGHVRTGSHVTIRLADRALDPAICPPDLEGFDSFTCDLPRGVSGHVAVHTGDSKLLGSNLSWPPAFGLSGWVVAENKLLIGKVQMDWAPALPITLAIKRRGDEQVRRAVVPSVSGAAGSPFSLPLDSMECDSSLLEISAVLPDGTCSPLAGSPLELRPISPRPVGAWPRRTLCALPDPEPTSNRMIDIVIPVYSGRDETLACLKSVLATTARNDAELLVVNDSSPDSELCEALTRLAHDGLITLLTNPSNLGFPGAANRGMNLHTDRDVVLLNSDTELFGNWLNRLKFAAYCEDGIGTVTPLGEAFSITSYPGTAGRAHTQSEAAEIDRIAREVNARKVVELPVGVGYCLYIKRACLTEVGTFDEITFGKGYGEENDFCLRARGLGWRHVAATDLFVRHRGARSYGRMKSILTERNSRILNALHPGYDALIADFGAADPLLDARRAIDIHRLLQEAIDPVLLVTFDLPGGVKRHVDTRQSELMAEGHPVLVLQPSGKHGRADQVILTAHNSGMENLVFNLPEELPVLHALLQKLQLSKIELHHFAGLPATALELVTSLGVSYSVYVHDYSWICPRLTLVGGTGVYCGEPPVEDCETCIRAHGTALEESLTVEALRIRSARILNGANAVIVPSDGVRTRLARYFPGVPVEVMPWERPLETVSRSRVAVAGRVRVAVIGAISIPKGYQILLECARDAADRDLDLEFVVIGFTCDDERLLQTGRVFITGPYDENEVDALLEREQCHIAFFPSVAPETWCYALSHALARGIPIIAFDLGAIAERLRAHVAADLLPLPASTALTNDALLRSARRINTSNPQKEPLMDSTSATNNSTVSDQLSASVQLLTLPAGIYTFTVKDGGPTATSLAGLTLPALQLGLAPMQSPGEIEFLAREGTSDRWLARSSDIIIAKIYGNSASLMLTSVRLPNNPPLAIDVRRLGAETFPLSPETAIAESSGGLPTQIIAHIQNLGDIPFTDGLAGCIAGRLWIEAFAVLSVGQLAPAQIEYCGITADGFQTPWLGNQVLCGSRGRGIPMMGFAIRLKTEIAEQYDCAYTGKFVSGSILGPFKNGDLCCSDVPSDPLWGIELRVTPRGPSEVMKPSPQIEHSGVAQT